LVDIPYRYKDMGIDWTKVDLSSEQQKHMAKLDQECWKSLNTLVPQLIAAEQEVEVEMLKDPVAQFTIDGILQRIVDLRQQIDDTRTHQITELKRILIPEQLEQLSALPNEFRGN
jgi:hypothetical protein